jgi:hypothetical protein
MTPIDSLVLAPNVIKKPIEMKLAMMKKPYEFVPKRRA